MPQRQEGDPQFLQPCQVGIGGEGTVKDQFLRHGPGAIAPEVDKAEDLLVTFFLAYLGIDIDEVPRLRIVRDQRQDTHLTAAAFGDVVFLYEGVLAVVRDGVEVEVKGGSPSERDAEAVCGLVPPLHEAAAVLGMDVARVLGERGALGHHVESGKQG